MRYSVEQVVSIATRIRIAKTEEFEVNQRECQEIRRRLYSLNRDNDYYRFRTMYEDGILIVFRLRKR